jgi:hypothetical protein
LNAPLPEWVHAYDFSGRCSTFRRSGTIKEIVEEAAPAPNEAMSRRDQRFQASNAELSGVLSREDGVLELAENISAGATV